MQLLTAEIDEGREWQRAYLTMPMECFLHQVLVWLGMPVIHKGEENLLMDCLNVKYDRMFLQF